MAVWQAFLRGHAVLLRALERDLQREHDLSLAEYDVLVQLNRAPDRRLRMGELAEALLFSSGGLTRLLDRLEQDGLVARERMPEDKRGVYAVLTETGRSRLRLAARTHIRGIERYFSAALPDDELPAVAAFLTRLATRPPSPE
jgi:DNA-binding MarR family transcriptional regulator